MIGVPLIIEDTLRGFVGNKAFNVTTMNEDVACAFAEISAHQIGGIINLSQNNARFKKWREFLICHATVVTSTEDLITHAVECVRDTIGFIEAGHILDLRAICHIMCQLACQKLGFT